MSLPYSSSASRRALLALAAVAALGSSPLALAQAKNEVRIAHVYSKTGPLEAYGKQTQTGLMMGLEYATGGTMTVAGTLAGATGARTAWGAGCRTITSGWGTTTVTRGTGAGAGTHLVGAQ